MSWPDLQGRLIYNTILLISFSHSGSGVILKTTRNQQEKERKMGLRRHGRTLTSILTIAFIVGWTSSIAMADPPKQNSAHLDGQNTDLSDQTLTISSPAVSWTNNTNIHDDVDSMDGCGAGLVISEYRISGSEGVLATVFHYDSGFEFYLRKLDYDGNFEWDYPTSGSFGVTASYSAAVVDAFGDIYFGDSFQIVKIEEDQGSPSTIHSWDISSNSWGTPISFHLCGTNFTRVVTGTTGGRVLLIVGEDEDDLWDTSLYDTSESDLYRIQNTAGVSNDGNYAYFTARDSTHQTSRLYAVDVADANSLPAEVNMPRLQYSPGVSTGSEASPLIREADTEGDFFIYYDVKFEINNIEEDKAICAKHDTSEGTITEQWTTELDGDVLASFAYGPVYYNNSTWKDVMWTFVDGEKTLKGIALEEIGTQIDPGDIVAELTVPNTVGEGDGQIDFSNYKILSAVTTSQNESTGNEKTIAMFNMQHKTSSTASSYIVALELEIATKNQTPDWTYELPGNRNGHTLGQFIIPDGENTVIFGQGSGSIISLE